MPERFRKLDTESLKKEAWHRGSRPRRGATNPVGAPASSVGEVWVTSTGDRHGFSESEMWDIHTPGLLAHLRYGAWGGCQGV